MNEKPNNISSASLELVTTPQDLLEVSKILSQQSLMGFDTEFVREKTYSPQLALIQVATEKEGWLIDVLALEHQAMKPLLEILTAPHILKVLHSALGDQEALYHTYGITASPTLDTFEAASLVGLGESVGLKDLVRRLLGITLGKSHSRTDWLRRPISEEMKHYALLDVLYLVELGKKLLQNLEELGRKQWALDLSATFQNPRLYQDPSEEIAKKVAASGKVSSRSYPLLKGLISWREQRARTLNIPRRRIADDETLLDIANARPKTVEQLEKFRGIQAAEIKRQGERILQIIHSQQEKAEGDFPLMPHYLKATMAQSRVIDLLGTYLRVLCEDLNIASRQLLTARELKKIVLEHLTEPEQWVQAGLCTTEVSQLIGEDLKAILLGKTALKVEGGKIKIIKL